MSPFTPKILVVDDNALMRTLLRAILREEKFDVIGEAANGEIAVDMVNKKFPDLVCLDIEMPVMGGIEALKIIKREHPEIVVLMISATSTTDAVREAVESGASGFVVKPFNVARVASTVRHAVSACRV